VKERQKTMTTKVAWSRRGEKFGPLVTLFGGADECFGWDGDAVAGAVQRCRREGNTQSAMPCDSTAFGLRAWQTGRCRVRESVQSAAFACIDVVMAILNTREPSRVPVRLFPATSLARCLRGAAKCSKQASSAAINPMSLSGQVEDLCYGNGRASNVV